MGRELSVNRIDFMKDGTIIIKDSPDRYICGRNEFTNALCRLFYNHNVEYLIVDYNRITSETGIDTIHVISEDSSWSDKEFDLEFSAVTLKAVQEICEEYIDEDDKELARENAMLNDAYCARRNTRTVDDFNQFSDLIDELQEHIDNYCEHAKLYWGYIRHLNLCSDQRKTEKSYILLTLSE